MFVEWSSDGQISAVYVEQQYPDQKWVPPSNEALQAFLGEAPKLGKDAKGGTCLRPAPSAFAQAAPFQEPGTTDEAS